MYNELDDKLKSQVQDYKQIMVKAYDRKYKNDAKMLSRYFTKLPTEAVPSRDIYKKLENRYNALPSKYRSLVQNFDLLDDYYNRLLEYEEGKQAPKKPLIKPEPIKEKEAPKKKRWLW